MKTRIAFGRIDFVIQKNMKYDCVKSNSAALPNHFPRPNGVLLHHRDQRAIVDAAGGMIQRNQQNACFANAKRLFCAVHRADDGRFLSGELVDGL